MIEEKSIGRKGSYVLGSEKWSKIEFWRYKASGSQVYPVLAEIVLVVLIET